VRDVFTPANGSGKILYNIKHEDG